MAPLIPQRLRRDPDGSFEAVYRRHVRDVYGFSLSLLGNADDAEDVAQTTFLNAYRALNRGERVDNMRAWLLAIAHNVCRQRFRTAARRPQEVELDPEAAEAFYDEDVPSAAEIRTAMGQLAFNQRTVLVLREIEGLSYDEIAQATGMSLSAVETLLFRARQALREQLEFAERDLGCDAVERLISLQLDDKLSRHDKRLLRAHLRACAECARYARSQRARKRAMPSLIAVPLPASLAGAFQGGGVSVVTAKVAALAVGAALVGTTGALVGKGVVPLPGGGGQRVEAAPVDAAGAAFVAAHGSLATPEARSVSFQERRRAAKLRERDLRVASERDAKSRSKPRSKPRPASDSGGGGGDGGVISSVVDQVQETVAGAASNVPAPPASVPVEPPAIPSVPVPDVPDVDGTGPLP